MSESQDRYQDYLKTEYWQQVSQLVKKRADYRCQLCNSQHNLQAHHRSYEHRGRELQGNNINDLICLCAACHGLFHRQTEPAPQFMGMARAAQKRLDDNQMVEVTKQNFRQIRSHKRAWHWIKDNGFNPRKTGWRQRMVGKQVPWFCFEAG